MPSPMRGSGRTAPTTRAPALISSGMGSARFEASLIPHRSTWAIIRLTSLPMLLALLMVLLAKGLASVSETASDAIGMLSGLVFMGGIFYVARMWQRGPKLTLVDGVLGVGPTRAPLAELRCQVGEYVFRSASTYSPGTFWMPMLTLGFPDGKAITIGCQGGGGRRERGKPTAAPQYHLDVAQWDRLCALVRAA